MEPQKAYHTAAGVYCEAMSVLLQLWLGFYDCASQIRWVNIIKNISLCSTDLQQGLPGILVLREENKLALISFPTCWRKTLVTVVQPGEKELLPWTLLEEGGSGGRWSTGLADVWPVLPQLGDLPFLPSGFCICPLILCSFSHTQHPRFHYPEESPRLSIYFFCCSCKFSGSALPASTTPVLLPPLRPK